VFIKAPRDPSFVYDCIRRLVHPFVVFPKAVDANVFCLLATCMAIPMAQAIPQTNLGTVDVDMEISSDLGYHAEEDNIDIDIDFSEEPVSRVDDAFMIDDDSFQTEATSNQVSPDLYNDDEMIDGDGTDAVHKNEYNQDEEFRDRSVDGESDVDILEEDEAVIGNEYSAEAVAVHVQEPQHFHSSTEKPHDSASALRSELESNNQISEPQDQIEARLKIANSDEYTQQPPEQEHLEGPVNGADFPDEDRNEFDIDDQHSFHEETPYQADKLGLGQQEKSPDFIEGTNAVHATQVLQAVDDLSKTSTLVADNIASWVHRPAAEAEIDQSPHHGLTNGEHRGGPVLHPVIVVYEDNEIYLFPPKNQDTSNTYFLEDESLAASSMKELFGACRTVLGESINDDLELELDVAELGLTLSEDSPHSDTSTLTSFLDLYLQLCRHDHIEAPGPLFVTLSTKFRYSACLTRLTDAVKEGKGLSQLHMLDEYNHSDESLEEKESYANLAGDQRNTQVGEECTQGTQAATPTHHANLDPAQMTRYLDTPEFVEDEPAYPDVSHETVETSAPIAEQTEGKTVGLPGEQDEADEVLSHIDVIYDPGESHEDDLIDFEDAEDDENAFMAHQGENLHMLSTDNSIASARAQPKLSGNDLIFHREYDLDDTGENLVHALQGDAATAEDAIDRRDVAEVDYEDEDNLDDVEPQDSSQLENTANTAPVIDAPLEQQEPSDQDHLAEYEQPDPLIHEAELEESLVGNEMAVASIIIAPKRSDDEHVDEDAWEKEDTDVNSQATVYTDRDSPRVAGIPKHSPTHFTEKLPIGKGARDVIAMLPREQVDGVDADLQQARVASNGQLSTRAAPIGPKSLSKKRSWIEHKEGDHRPDVAKQVKKPRSASDQLSTES